MAIHNYIGWGVDVNRVILDSTTITVGEGALLNSEIENGYRRSRLRTGFIPDKYSVTMEFEWEETDANGISEVQKFWSWYKYQHKFGTVPFEFPQIVLSPQTGIRAVDINRKIHQVEYYKITSAVEGSKSGTKQQIKMTWETVYAGIVNIPDKNAEIRNISATDKYVEVIFSSLPDVAPLASQFRLYMAENATPVASNEITMSGFYFDNSNTVRLYYNKTVTSKTKFSISYTGYGLYVPVGTLVTVVNY